MIQIVNSMTSDLKDIFNFTALSIDLVNINKYNEYIDNDYQLEK